jgi:riboflavin kinase/FMN adenylyltransferase
MQLIRQLTPHAVPPSSVAIGNFDGLHLGHQAVMGRMQALAAQLGLAPAVLTFAPHPRKFFAPHSPDFALEPIAERLRHLRHAGVTHVAMPRFNAGFAAQSPAQFLNDVLGEALQARAVITGENFAFGAHRAGNVAQLREWGSAHGIAVETVPPVRLADGTICSSSAIRQLVESGDVARAGVLLGRPYRISGRVVHGDGRGRELGFPTANVTLPRGIKLPAYGVYAVRALCRGVAHNAVANLGLRPTIGAQHQPKLEVHLFDYAGDLYGARMEVQFISHIRPEQKFDSLPTLVNQMHRDCIAAQVVLKAAP